MTASNPPPKIRKTGIWQLPRLERFKIYAPPVSHSSEGPEGDSSSAAELEHGEHLDSQGLESTLSSLYRIFQGGQPEQIMIALLDRRYWPAVKLVPSSVFVEAFNLLSPAYFIEPYRTLHRPLHPMAIEIRGYKPLEAIFTEFTTNLARIVQIRRGAGHKLGLAEYTHLLRCAASMGDAPMAEIIWADMKEDGVKPDVQSYNYYMEANIWDNTYVGREKYRLRVTPFYYRKRRYDSPSTGWEGFGTASKSVRKHAVQIFEEMTEQGIYGDEASFVNLFLASSRVGHGKGMKNILKTAWNIDVDLLMTENDDAKIPPITFYEPTSPLRPTGRLLFAVAHGYGSNNDLNAALRLVDFISRSYNLTIPENVWVELLERAYVLSRKKFGPDQERNAKGQVPPEFVTGIFHMMISEPFNVRPSVQVYRLLAKMAWEASRLRDFLSYMDAAYDLLQETRRERKEARNIVEKLLGYPFSMVSGEQRSVPESVLQSKAFLEAVNEYEILRLSVAQQTILMERLTRLLLSHCRWMHRDNRAWERIHLANKLQEWRDFLPGTLHYNTHSGRVLIHGETSWGQFNIRSHNYVPVRRSAGNQTAENGEENEVDDDFLWQAFGNSLDPSIANRAPIRRLFWMPLNYQRDTDHPVMQAYNAEEGRAEGVKGEIFVNLIGVLPADRIAEAPDRTSAPKASS
ncbi:Mitochondrial ATPase expression domain containing protein [Elaphomyces granulatus]